MAAPAVAEGVKIGVLLGTAYLFTEEAVASGAIQTAFQKAAVECTGTVILAATPGYATRCLPSPFCETFESERRRLILQGTPLEEMKQGLEELNIGRLRIASKGLDHNPDYGKKPGEPKLVGIEENDQWQQGMYMIGQVASLRDRTVTLAELHAEVSDGSTYLLEVMRVPSEGDEYSRPRTDIAIVGMSSILPGSADLAAFWANVLNKVDAIREVPADRWDFNQYFDPDPEAEDKVYSKWGGFIEEVPFDPLEWGMPPSSLPSIEPFQLLALELVRSAVEDAGYTNRPFVRERTSVILGAGGGAPDLTAGYVVRSSLAGLFGSDMSDELTARLDGTLPHWTEDSFPGLLMNVAAGRVANRFDFGGINYTVDAACASSLAAIYLGIRDLQARTSDVVIAGGAEGIQNPFDFLCFAKTHALSPTGRSRPFDANADGIAISEGFASLFLKRLEDAERDGDRIYAVIRGAGASSDGRDKGLTAPRPEGQMRAFRRAYQEAGFSPATVGLFEAHGTGTVAGDQAEISSLTQLLTEAGAEPNSSAIGSGLAPALAITQPTGPNSRKPPGGIRAGAVSAALTLASLVVLDQVWGDSAAVLVEVEGAAQRGEGPLRAVVAFADPATGTDRGGDLTGQIEPLRVDQPMGVPEFAAKADRERLTRLAIARGAPFDGAGHPHVAAAVGHLGDLHQDLAWVGERLVDVPQRAGAAAGREVKTGGGLSFRHVSRPIHPHEREGDAAHCGPLQG